MNQVVDLLRRIPVSYCSFYGGILLFSKVLQPP